MAQPTTHWHTESAAVLAVFLLCIVQEPEGRMFEPGTPASGAQTTQRATASSISQQILGELPSPPPRTSWPPSDNTNMDVTKESSKLRRPFVP